MHATVTMTTQGDRHTDVFWAGTAHDATDCDNDNLEGQTYSRVWSWDLP